MDIGENGSGVWEGLFTGVFDDFDDVLCREISILFILKFGGDTPQPYAICAIWLLGTMLPFAFLTILGLASAAPLGATAIVSMVPTMGFSSSSSHCAHRSEKVSCFEQ